MNALMIQSRYRTPLYEDFNLSDGDVEDWTETLSDQDHFGHIE